MGEVPACVCRLDGGAAAVRWEEQYQGLKIWVYRVHEGLTAWGV